MQAKLLISKAGATITALVISLMIVSTINGQGPSGERPSPPPPSGVKPPKSKVKSGKPNSNQRQRDRQAAIAAQRAREAREQAERDRQERLRVEQENEQRLAAERAKSQRAEQEAARERAERERAEQEAAREKAAREVAERRTREAEEVAAAEQARREGKEVWQVIWLQNRTQGPIPYVIWINGKDQTHTLEAGKPGLIHWSKGDMVIKFDHSYASGFQEKRYRVTPKYIIGHEPNEAEQQMGKLNYFKLDDNGNIELYNEN
jgi:hypothetical protein